MLKINFIISFVVEVGGGILHQEDYGEKSSFTQRVPLVRRSAEGAHDALHGVCDKNRGRLSPASADATQRGGPEIYL